MSLDQLEQQVLGLPREERRRFARWFYEHENEIVEPDEIDMAIRSEIISRRDESLAHPELMKPVTDDWFDSLKHKLTAIRKLRSAAE